MSETRVCIGTKSIPGCGETKPLNRENFQMTGGKEKGPYYCNVCRQCEKKYKRARYSLQNVDHEAEFFNSIICSHLGEYRK